jgi:hypothetical protein
MINVDELKTVFAEVYCKALIAAGKYAERHRALYAEK